MSAKQNTTQQRTPEMNAYGIYYEQVHHTYVIERGTGAYLSDPLPDPWKDPGNQEIREAYIKHIDSIHLWEVPQDHEEINERGNSWDNTIGNLFWYYADSEMYLKIEKNNVTYYIERAIDEKFDSFMCELVNEKASSFAFCRAQLNRFSDWAGKSTCDSIGHYRAPDLCQEVWGSIYEALDKRGMGALLQPKIMRMMPKDHQFQKHCMNYDIRFDWDHYTFPFIWEYVSEEFEGYKGAIMITDTVVHESDTHDVNLIVQIDCSLEGRGGFSFKCEHSDPFDVIDDEGHYRHGRNIRFYDIEKHDPVNS